MPLKFAEAIDGIRYVNLMKKLGMKLEGIQRSQVKDNFGQTYMECVKKSL